MCKYLSGKQLATDQTDRGKLFPRQVFTPYFRLLISTAFVVVSRVGCLGVIGVIYNYADSQDFKSLIYTLICLSTLTAKKVNFPLRQMILGVPILRHIRVAKGSLFHLF